MSYLPNSGSDVSSGFYKQIQEGCEASDKERFRYGDFKIAIRELEENGQLTNRNNPHKLSGKYIGFWEAHLKPDWLLIWSTFRDDKEIWLTRTGSHADLF